MKVLILGAGGLLGRYLAEMFMQSKGDGDELYIPDHEALDVREEEEVDFWIGHNKPDVVIHCAAVTDNRQVEQNVEEALAVNIGGTLVVAMCCMRHECRLVYISTDYVYKGDRGNYKETDELLPFNLYAWTKLGGECAVRAVKDHLIIRTSFGSEKFGYSQAFIDKWSSKDYVAILAPRIAEASLSTLTGVINIGTDRKSLYDYARVANPSVKPVRLRDTNFVTPQDTSLNTDRWMDYKTSKPIVTRAKHCRVCHSTRLTKYLDLGQMPMANNLELTKVDARQAQRFPLQVMVCEDCGWNQLSNVVDPSVLYSYYTYRSGINKGYIAHCETMCKDIEQLVPLMAFHRHIDIAGNDGTLLRVFQERWKHTVLNVDPAANLVAIAEADGIESTCRFWGIETADGIMSGLPGDVQLITATNVFAHVDNITEFLQAAKMCLAPEGILVIECPYLGNFLDGMEFDTVYFEHLSYLSVTPLIRLLDQVDLALFHVVPQVIHGGTIRLHISHPGTYKVRQSVQDILQYEEDKQLGSLEVYRRWNDRVYQVKNQFSSQLLTLKRNGAKICAFAASAKGNTLLNFCGINTDIIDWIADETPEKIGKFSPGTGIPIVNKQRIQDENPDFLVILSWNFAEEIMQKCRPLFSGKFIIPLPEFRIVE